MFNNVLCATLLVMVLPVAACSPVSDSDVTSPTPKPVTLSGQMVVPPPWVVPTGTETCTAELRTTPFDAASSVTLDAVRGEDRWTVEENTLGTGALRDGACAFTVSLDVPDDTYAEAYRLTVKSSTSSLMVTWDYPADVVRSGAPLAMPLTDKILVY